MFRGADGEEDDLDDSSVGDDRDEDDDENIRDEPKIQKEQQDEAPKDTQLEKSASSRNYLRRLGQGIRTLNTITAKKLEFLNNNKVAPLDTSNKEQENPGEKLPETTPTKKTQKELSDANKGLQYHIRESNKHPNQRLMRGMMQPPLWRGLLIARKQPVMHIMSGLAVISAVLAIVENEFFSGTDSLASDAVKGCISLISFIMVVEALTSNWNTLRRSAWQWWNGIGTWYEHSMTFTLFFLTVMINAVHVPPKIILYLTVSQFSEDPLFYNLDSVAILLISLRCYRCAQSWKELYRYHQSQVRSMGRASNVTMDDTWFNFRLLMTQHPIQLLIFIFGVVVLYAAYLLRAMEAPYEAQRLSQCLGGSLPSGFTEDTALVYCQSRQFVNMGNTLYYLVVTVATVGYGDFYPKTNLGRFIGVGSIVAGMLLTSLIVAVIIEKCLFSPWERRFFDIIVHKRDDTMLQTEALQLLQLTWRRKRERKLATEDERNDIDRQIKVSFLKFRRLRLKAHQTSNKQSWTELFAEEASDRADKMRSSTRGNFFRLEKQMDDLNDVILKAKEMEDEQALMIGKMVRHMGLFSAATTGTRTSSRASGLTHSQSASGFNINATTNIHPPARSTPTLFPSK